MSFMDDIKTDQRTQILVAGILAFALLFPGYFYYAAGLADDDLVFPGPVGDYAVTGEYSYHLLDSGSQEIQDEGTAEITVNSDSIANDIDGKNIVGVRATLTYTDNEQAGAGCDTAEDDVSGHLMHSDLHETQEVDSGDVVEILWHNSSIIGTTVMNMTESDIIALLENQDGLGIGQHVLQISVDVNRGGCAGDGTFVDDENDDNSETVEYSIELISLEYDLEMVEDAEEEEEEEDSEE